MLAPTRCLQPLYARLTFGNNNNNDNIKPKKCIKTDCQTFLPNKSIRNSSFRFGVDDMKDSHPRNFSKVGFQSLEVSTQYLG
eukprot:2183315-Amphidinium_carterae.1